MSKRNIKTHTMAINEVADGITKFFEDEPINHYLYSHEKNCWKRRPVCEVCEKYTYYPFDDASKIITWDCCFCEDCEKHAKENNDILPDPFRIEADGEPHLKIFEYPIKVKCRDCHAKKTRDDYNQKKRDKRDRDRSEERERERDANAKKRRDQGPGNASGEGAGTAAGDSAHGQAYAGGAIQRNTSSMTATEKQNERREMQLAFETTIVEREQAGDRKGKAAAKLSTNSNKTAAMIAQEEVRKRSEALSSTSSQSQTADSRKKPRKLKDAVPSPAIKPSASTKSTETAKPKGMLGMASKSGNTTRKIPAQTKSAGSAVAPKTVKSSPSTATKSTAAKS